MVAVSAQMVKALREQTGAGMMDCKKALNETGGVLGDAVDWLRTKGLSLMHIVRCRTIHTLYPSVSSTDKQMS